MVQTSVYRNMGRTGGIVKLDIAPQDQIPESQELENKEDIIKKAAGRFKIPTNPDAPSFVENIITSKFYAVQKPPTIETVEREPAPAATDERGAGS